MNLGTYSDKTKCPDCECRVMLEAVRFVPTFFCPSCGGEIHVSERYRKVMTTCCFLLAWALPIAFGLRNVLIIFLVSVPLYGALVGLWAYVGKYVFPPDLQPLVKPYRRGILGL